jgi:hypothetical protein
MPDSAAGPNAPDDGASERENFVDFMKRLMNLSPDEVDEVRTKARETIEPPARPSH